MFSYEFENLFRYRVSFGDGWKRFRSCNAAVYHKEQYRTQRSVQQLDVEKWYFVSYATPIAKIVRLAHPVDGCEKWMIVLEATAYDHNPTTTRQLNQLLDSLWFFDGMPQDTRLYDFVKSDVADRSQIYHPTKDVTLAFNSRGQMDYTFYRECPRFECHAI